MSELLTSQELDELTQAQKLLDEAYTHYFEVSDGYSKITEGHIAVHLGNFFDRRAGNRNLCIEVYAAVIGYEKRSYFFESTSDMLEVIKEWHKEELADDHKGDAWNQIGNE